MLRAFTKAILTTALLAASASAKETLCALPTASLTAAAQQYPEISPALDVVRKQAIATWYTDRESVESCTNKVTDILATCDEDTRVTLVVYGLPNKDCAAGYSASGSNKNAEDYKKWVQQLADGVGQRKALYVLEPDAVGLLADGGCGADPKNGYAANVKAALEILSKNPNADIYLDVGYWTLFKEEEAATIAATVKELAAAGRLKGIALNTSNYRSNKEISALCATFQKAYGDDSLHCIVDTSRNYNKAPPSTEWCNANFGGIGQPPTANTKFDNLDYFIWIKPAGESDGECDGSDHTKEAMRGPTAGAFYKDHFVKLWNNGYYVNEKEYPSIGTDGAIQEPVTPEPTDETPEPTTDDPEPTTTAAPDSGAPVVSSAPTPTEPESVTPVVSSPPTPTDPESETPVANPSQMTPTQVPMTPALTPEDEASPTPVASVPVRVATTTSAPVAAYESGERANDATPVPTPAITKKKKKVKRCESGLQPLTEEEEPELVPGEVMTAYGTNNSTVNAYDNHEAPSIEVGLAPATEVNNKADLSASTGMSGGVLAVIVIAGVVAIAVAALTFRRRAEDRRRSNTLRTPVEAFGELRATPAQVTVL